MPPTSATSQTEPTVEAIRPNSEVPATTKPLSPPRADKWTTGYGLLLIGLIIAYYALMVYIAGELFRWAVECLRDFLAALDNQQYGWTACYLLLTLVLAFLLIRTVRHLIYAAAGLVTPIHEFVPEATEGIEVTRVEYPKLFALLDRVGDSVGSVRPDEVRVHHPPESFTVELREFGIRPQRRLILVLSLPQLGVFTDAEMGVIIAHELSHFGRGYTRLIVFLDRFVNSLRMSTDAIGHRWWHWIDPIYWIQLGYMRAMLLLSAPLQRQEELRADSISATLYGGELAARTLLKDWLLSNQFLTAIGSYESSIHPTGGSDGQPPETIFGWFRRRWHDFSADGEDYLLRRLESQQKSTFWSDDPTMAERVHLMRKYPAVEIATVRPMRELVDNIDALENQLHTEVMEE